MTQKSKYDPIIDTLPGTQDRKEILFRVAGDDQIQVEYGRTPLIDYMDMFRVILVAAEVERRRYEGYTQTEGIIELVPSWRTWACRFDPRVVPMTKVIDAIKSIEQEVGDNRDIAHASFNSPIIEMPIAFEDPLIKEANEIYIRDLKPEGSVDIDPVYGDSLTYMANYIGLTREEWKKKFLATEWFCWGMSFLIGLVLLAPLDRRCFLRTSKSNPPRVYSPRGGVAFGSFVIGFYPAAAPGGYHLIGRTSPLYNPAQNHPSFKNDVALCHTLDRIKWYQVSPEELLRTEKLVDSGSSEYIYQKTPGRFSIGEWLEFEKEHKDEIETWLKQTEEYAAKALIP